MKLIKYLILSLVLAISMNQVYAKTEISNEVNCFATTVFKEARGESYKGKSAIAQVILNRMKHPKFPDTACKVMKQKGQFSWYSPKGSGRLLKGDLRGFKSKDIESYSDAHQIALKAFYGVPEYNPKLSKALYFVHKSVSPSRQPWLKKLNFITSIGQHEFYGEKS